MKKGFMLLAALCCVAFASAQKKGDKYIGANFGINVGTNRTSTEMIGTPAFPSTPGMPSTLEIPTYSEGPKTRTTTLGLAADFGYFVCDNFKVSLNVGWMFNNQATENIYGIDGGWNKTTTSSFELNPSLSYYCRIIDGLYYTPEVGAAFGWGKHRVPSYTSDERISSPCNGWDVYGYVASFEVKVTDTFALGVAYGRIAYTSDTYNYDNSQFGVEMKSVSKGFTFDLGTAHVSARFYL